MATSRHDSDLAPERKKARIVFEPQSTSLPPPSSSSHSSLSRWEFAPTPVSSSSADPYHVATRNGRSPDVAGNSSDSISLTSGSSDASLKSSPTASPNLVGAFNAIVPKSLGVSPSCGNMAAISVGNAVQSTQNQVRPLLIDEQSADLDNGPISSLSSVSAVGVVAPWQLQDFADGLAFDGSLSGLSDLTAPGYANDLVEFVKRQSNQSACNGVERGDNFFQYVLMAPTSAAIKLYEEPLTYLNQGQSYEVKCKKLGGEGLTPGRLFKSVIRVTFHDRRQKFHERELLDRWKKMHNADKIIDADVPLSYNVFNVRTDPSGNMVEFLWDPTKSTSTFVKINCISTEFTAHKHGGEKGVPFRLQIDTFFYGDNVEHKHLHSSYAQVKVFKTKGADRKNKTDRDKAEKRADKEKYQPAYDYTILTEAFPTDVCDYEQQQQPSDCNGDNSDQSCPPTKQPVSPPRFNGTAPIICRKLSQEIGNFTGTRLLPENGFGTQNEAIQNEGGIFEGLAADAKPAETLQWLRQHRFGNYLKVFGSFSGADLLCLSREDLIQICGTADGIRLFNALQYKKLQPKLTLYVCVPGAPAFHAVFLVMVSLPELVRKMCDLIQIQPSQVFDVYCQGPDGINVHMNDEVVQNLPDRSRYVIDAMKCGDEQLERYRILLKATSD